jgi:hypothetical protein
VIDPTQAIAAPMLTAEGLIAEIGEELARGTWWAWAWGGLLAALGIRVVPRRCTSCLSGKERDEGHSTLGAGSKGTA